MNQNYALQIYIPSFFGVVLLLAMIARLCMLQNSAQTNQKHINWSLAFRIVLIVILMAIDLAFLANSIFYVNSEFYHNFKCTYFGFEFILLTFQVCSLILEYQKQVPIFWIHKVYWAETCVNCYLNLYIAYIAANWVEGGFYGGKALAATVLSIYSFLIKKQDYLNFENVAFFQLSVPKETLIAQYFIEEEEEKKPDHENFIVVQIQKEWKSQISSNGNVSLDLTINVSFHGRKQKIMKSIEDFYHLEKQLSRIQEQSRNFNYPFSIPECIDEFSSQNQIIEALQNYLDLITADIEYYFPPLLDFFHIPKQDQQKIIEERKRRSLQLSLDEQIIKQDLTRSESCYTDFRKKPKRQIRSMTDSQEYSPIVENERGESNEQCERYFVITSKGFQKQGDHFVFQFQIVYIHSRWRNVIEKRYQEFRNLNQSLKLMVNGLPKLPIKKLVLNLSSLQVRQLGLLRYLQIILNEDKYLKSVVFSFIEFDENQFSFVKQIVDISNFIAETSDTYLQKEEEKPCSYVVYRFIIKCNDQREIKKRFTDFEQLDKSLKIYFQNADNLPFLPAKYTTFGQQTTVETRKKELSRYLNELFKVGRYNNIIKIEGIADCYQFRQFISWSSQQNNNKGESIALNSQNEIQSTGSLIRTIQQYNLENDEKLEKLDYYNKK